MKLFITFGSWGEIAPLLEIALQFQDRGQGVTFATTPDWSPRVRAYGITCHDLPKAEKHADTLNDFLKAHLLGRVQAIYNVIEQIKPSSIVCTFYTFPAQVYADRHGIPCVVTTTSPYYFMRTEIAEVYPDIIDECLKFGAKGLAYPLAGVYPWYLHENVGAIPIGWPQLRPLTKLSDAVAEFIKEPYGVVSRGTLVSRSDLDRMVNAIHAHGLKCLYLGPHECKADLSAFLDNHAEAVKGAKVVITHAGIGTTVDCMSSAMVVDPVGYDQFYNANRLIDLKCAVGVKDSYIRAISEALKPRSFLPNSFDIDAFLRLFDEHTPRNARRHAADASEHTEIH